jgi:hypothetical protein
MNLHDERCHIDSCFPEQGEATGGCSRGPVESDPANLLLSACRALSAQQANAEQNDAGGKHCRADVRERNKPVGLRRVWAEHRQEERGWQENGRGDHKSDEPLQAFCELGLIDIAKHHQREHE